MLSDLLEAETSLPRAFRPCLEHKGIYLGASWMLVPREYHQRPRPAPTLLGTGPGPQQGEDRGDQEDAGLVCIHVGA